MKSTESLHSSVHELHEATAKHSEQIAQLIRVVEIDAENIRRLANIAEAHERRLGDIEGE